MSSLHRRSVAVLGGGRLGTAFVFALTRHNPSTRVNLFLRDAEQCSQLLRGRGQSYPRSMFPTTNAQVALRDTHQAIFFTIPARFVADFLEKDSLGKLLSELPVAVPIVVLSRGLDNKGRTAVELLSDARLPVVQLGGPILANELQEGKPTTFLAAGPSVDHCRIVSELLPLVNSSRDARGVAICSAANICFSMAAGYLSVKWDAQAALSGYLSRCVADLRSLLEALNCDPMTALSEAGVGDLLLSCTSNAVPSYVLGTRLAQGLPAHIILRQFRQKGGGGEVEATISGMSVLLDRLREPLPVLRAVLSMLRFERRGEELAAVVLNPKERGVHYAKPSHELFESIEVMKKAITDPTEENKKAGEELRLSLPSPPPAMRQSLGFDQLVEKASTCAWPK